MDKKQAEELKEKLFQKKENGWKSKTQEEKQQIFEYARGYIDYMNQSKTEREIISNSKEMWISKYRNMSKLKSRG